MSTGTSPESLPLPRDPLYGCTIALPISLSGRTHRRSIFLLLLFLLGLVGYCFAADGTDPRIAVSRVLGLVLAGFFAITQLMLIARAKVSWRFELTDRQLLVPPTSLFQRRHITIPFDDIVDMGRGFKGEVVVVYRKAKAVAALPADCFPAGWDAGYVVGRIAVRWKLWLDGKRLTADQLAVIEAQLDHVDKDGKPATAVMLLPSKVGGRPIVFETYAADGSERQAQWLQPPGESPPKKDEPDQG